LSMEAPRFFLEGWEDFDEKTGKWKLKPDAPDWAKKEFKEFYALVNAAPDENGVIIKY